MGNIEKGQSTTTKPEITFEEMLNGIEDIQSDHASSEDEEDGENEDYDIEYTRHGKLSEDDEPGWVLGTMSPMVLHRMESFRQKQMRLDQLTQPGWEDVANYFWEGDMRYGITELQIPADGMPQTDLSAATPSLTTFRELMQALHIVTGQSRILQVTSRHGGSHRRLGWEKPQADDHIVPPIPASVPDSSQIQIAKPSQPISFCPCT
jgi:hypothetical protein